MVTLLSQISDCDSQALRSLTRRLGYKLNELGFQLLSPEAMFIS